MRWVLIYDLVDDYLERRPRCVRTTSLWRGSPTPWRYLLLAGALADPYDRALLVFAGDTPEVAEAFALADLYVVGGLVTSWTVRQWNEVLTSA